jgi:hypothetical protein
MKDTGNGAVITFGTSGFTADFTMVGEVAQELAKIETSHLGTVDVKEYMPGDLSEPGEFDAELEFDPEDNLPPLGTIETITITWPLSDSTNSVEAALAGTGFIRKRSTPQLKNGELQSAKVTIAFDGLTGPAFTPESAGGSGP